MIGSSTEPDSVTKPGTNGGAPAQPDELAGLLELTFDRLSSSLEELRILGSVHTDRARLRLRRVIAGAQVVVILSIVAMVCAAAGTVLVASGLAGTFRALFADRPWIGDLVAGVVLLGSVATVWVGLRLSAESSEAKRLEKKYADLETQRAPRP